MESCWEICLTHPIGFTADLGEKVIPNIVGVDIGCGMLATKIEEPHIDFRKLDKIIRESVPYGKGGVWAAPECTKEFPLIDRLFCKAWMGGACSVL